jgi:hypothetical protein
VKGVDRSERGYSAIYESLGALLYFSSWKNAAESLFGPPFTKKGKHFSSLWEREVGRDFDATR